MNIDRDKLRELYLAGVKVKDIGAQLGIPFQRVSDIAHAMGLPRRLRSTSELPSNRMAALYEQGWSTNRIARQFGTCHTIVRRLLLQRGIKMRGWKGSRPDLRAECVRLFRAGWSHAQIGLALGLPRQQVGYRVRSVLGAGQRGRPSTIPLQVLFALRRQGLSYAAIGREVGRSGTAIRLRMLAARRQGAA